MGLDAVEIVMLTEERFGIVISDSEAEKIRTPGMLIALVQVKVALASEKICLSQKSFYLLRRAIVRLTNVDRKKVTPNVGIRDFVTSDREVVFWPELRTALGARSWPALDFAPEIERAVSAMILGIWPCSGFIAWLSLRKIFDPLNAAICSFFIGLLVARGTAVLLKKMGKPLQTFIPRRVQTLVDLVPFVNTSDEIKWSRDDIARAVREIVEEVLAPGDKYREDADFVKDLGLS
jgi:hypothetical protein